MNIHRHSGWLIPLGLFSVIAALCGIFLLYYLRPATRPVPGQPPDRCRQPWCDISIRGLKLKVPARYIESRAARGGGDQDVVPLFAALPDMRGYSDAEAALFAGNAADLPVVHLLLRADTNSLDMQKPAHPHLHALYHRFQRRRRRLCVSRAILSAPIPAMAATISMLEIAAESLFLCERPAQDIPSPNCLAIDRPIAPGVNLSYRFKRAQLSHWREIGEGANRLIAGFRE